MEYDRGDSFPFNFEPNGIPFGSKSKGKLSPRSYPIECERNWTYSFLSVRWNARKPNTGASLNQSKPLSVIRESVGGNIKGEASTEGNSSGPWDARKKWDTSN